MTIMLNLKGDNQMQYRVVTAGKGRLHKTYFKSYDKAMVYFSQISRRLRSNAYAELQELDTGAYLTVEQAGGAYND